MRNKLEHFLLVSLLAISIILGLSFWLNTIFNFNIFCQDHWNELARLQASHTPVDMGFYISIIIALLLFLACTYIIYFPLNKQKNLKPEKTNVEQTSNKISPKQKDTKEEKSIEDPIPVPHTMVSRPPRLKLPTNMAEIAAQRQKQMTSQPKVVAPEQNPYTNMLSQIFSENGYVVKPNPKISGFTPNLFAIGTEEAVWIGAVDVDANKMIDAVKRLDSVFQETLDDIQININAFINKMIHYPIS